MSSKCVVCGKAAYNMEKVSVEGITFHKTCFKCAECKATLKLGSYASLKGKYYCKPHFKQLFSLKGNYDEGFGEEQHKKKWLGKELGEQNQEQRSSTPERNERYSTPERNERYSTPERKERNSTPERNERSSSSLRSDTRLSAENIFHGLNAKGIGLNGAKISPGEITVFTLISSSDAPPFSVEDISVTVEDKTNNTSIPAEVFDNKDGSYDVEWTPGDGSHSVDIKVQGKHIKGSPFRVDIGVESVFEETHQSEQPQNPSESEHHSQQHAEVDIYPDTIAKGSGLNGSMLNPNEPSVFMIQCSDTSVTEDIISVKIFGPSNPKAEVFSNGDGTFDVEWIPPALGKYTIEITIDNKPIFGSPFTVFLGPMADSESNQSSHPATPAKKIDPTVFEKMAKEQSEAKIHRTVESPEVHSRAALDRVAQFQKTAQDQSEGKIKKMVDPNKIEGKKVDASEFEKLAKQEADSKIKRMVDLDSVSKEISGKKLDPTEFEKLAKQESEARVKRMVDSPKAVGQGVSAKVMTAAFESKKVSSVEVKRTVDSPSPTSRGAAKQITSLFETKNVKGVDVKRMVEQPAVQSKAALSRVAQFEQAAQSSKLKTRMVDVESVQEQTRGKKINPLDFEKLAKQQADSKVKRMVDLEKVQAEARGKKLNPEDFEKKVKEDSDAKVKRMVDLEKVQAEARGKKLNPEDFERKAKEESETKVKRMVDLDQVQAEARGKKLSPAEFEKRAKEDAESKVQRMVDLEKVQAEARGKKLTPEEFERKAKEESETKVKRMVDPEKVQAEAQGKKLTPEEFEKRAKEDAEAKVKKMVDLEIVQAEARGKKLTPEEFERKAKEEAEAKIKRMANPDDVQSEARGQTSFYPAKPSETDQTNLKPTQNERDDDGEDLLSELGSKLSHGEYAPEKQTPDHQKDLLSELGSKLSHGDYAPENQTPEEQQISPDSTPTSKSTANGMGIHPSGNKSNELTVFTIYPKNSNGEPMSVSTSDLSIVITGPGSPSHEIYDNENNSFDVEWEPPQAGEYKIDVRVVGQPVKDNPFTVVVS